MGLNLMCVFITSFWIAQTIKAFTQLSIGGNGGVVFDDMSSWSVTYGPIRQVTMQCYHQYVGSIQINYGGINGSRNGNAGRDGTTAVVQVDLDQGELIEGVDAWGDSIVNGIQFITSTGYKDLCGYKNGNFISVRNRELAYISGRAGNIIDKITFYWKDIVKCQENTCLNNGTCLNTIQGYFCSCAPGFNGQNCEKDAEICQQNTCLNNGTCLETTQGFFCSCAPGFNGKNCENDTYECQENTCFNNGTCLNTIQGYFCSCPPSFNGKNCENEEPCDSNHPCCELESSYTSNMTYLELKEKLESLRKENLIAKNSTAMFKRSKISAKDYRISSTITGSVLGVFTISILLLVMLFSDFPLLIRHMISGTS